VTLDELGDIIAERVLTAAEQQGTPKEISVLLGKPRQLPDHPDYYCTFQIKGAGSEKVRHACGVDSLQALQFAISALAVELEVLNKQMAGALRWEYGEKGGLGIPVTHPNLL
jgi:Domain of unknown function (DUF6968)